MKNQRNIIECCNNTHQGAPHTGKQTLRTRIHKTVGQYSAIPYTKNTHVEWKTVTGNPQVTCFGARWRSVTLLVVVIARVTTTQVFAVQINDVCTLLLQSAEQYEMISCDIHISHDNIHVLIIVLSLSCPSCSLCCLVVCDATLTVDEPSQVQSTHLRQSDVLRSLWLSAVRTHSSRAQVYKYDASFFKSLPTPNRDKTTPYTRNMQLCHLFALHCKLKFCES